jgi:hypothetical protein
MERLVAHFTIPLAAPLLVEDREDAVRAFEVAHGTYAVEITWKGEHDTSRWQPKHLRASGLWYYGISRLTIAVSHPETEPYPTDADKVVPYLEPRLKAYARAAEAVTNRLIQYFKFTLGNPLVQEITAHQLDVSSPTWTDETGEPLRPRWGTSEAKIPVQLTRYFSHFGIKVFTSAQSNALETALQTDSRYELYEELLADARAALLQEHLKRAVLEMAIACEVTTKGVFVKKGKLTEDALEKVPVYELLNKESKAAFGTSFFESHKKDWHNIRNLFRCRNHVAHRGILQYKDQYGTLRTADLPTLRNWWDSLTAAIAWIQSR